MENNVKEWYKWLTGKDFYRHRFQQEAMKKAVQLSNFVKRLEQRAERAEMALEENNRNTEKVLLKYIQRAEKTESRVDNSSKSLEYKISPI